MRWDRPPEFGHPMEFDGDPEKSSKGGSTEEDLQPVDELDRALKD